MRNYYVLIDSIKIDTDRQIRMIPYNIKVEYTLYNLKTKKKIREGVHYSDKDTDNHNYYIKNIYAELMDNQ